MDDLDQRIAALEGERRAIQRDIGPKQERLMQIHETLRPLQELKSRAWLKEMGETPDWPLIIRVLAGNSPLSSVALIRYTEKHLEPFCMRHSGYWSETQEACFQVMLTKGAPETIRKAVEGVRYFTPLMTAHPDGFVWFRIFEHTLSAGAVYELKVKPDLSHITVGSRWRTEEFTDLEKAVVYIHDHHWYDRADGRSSDEEDQLQDEDYDD
jgi:hypothetical protein